jgi:hypothetical protein
MSLLALFRRTITECPTCGYDIAPHHKRVVNGDKIFCSPDCEEEYLEDHIIVVPQELPLEQLELRL